MDLINVVNLLGVVDEGDKDNVVKLLLIICFDFGGLLF